MVLVSSTLKLKSSLLCVAAMTWGASVLDWAWRSAARSRPNPLGQRGSMNPTHLPLSSAQHQHPNMCGVLDIPKLHNVYYVEHAFEHTPQQAKSNATSCLNEQ
ncbi:hypothetical protein A2U01_0042165, partial [Trifolium medium]|nr:hypothetical protein [Trifolium medium]